MRANVIPATTLISVAVFANEEVIADIPPAPIVHVEVLIRSDDRGARLLIPTVFGYAAMMDHYVRRRCDRQNLKIETLPGLPFASADDSRTLWISQKKIIRRSQYIFPSSLVRDQMFERAKNLRANRRAICKFLSLISDKDLLCIDLKRVRL